MTALPRAAERDEARGYAMIAAAAAMWGSWSLFFRPAERLQPVAPALEAMIVLTVVGATMLPSALRDRPAASRPLRAWLGMLALGVGDAMNALCFFWAMQRTSIAIAVLSHYLAPLFIALFAPLALGEPSRRSTWASLGAALAGLALLLEPWKAAAGAGTAAGAGALLGAVSAVFYAGNVFINKKLQRWFSPRELLGYHAFPAMAVVAAFVPKGGFVIGGMPLLLIAIGGLLPGTLAGLLFTRGLFLVPASRASVLTLLEPLVAVGVAATVWGEVPGPAGVAGGGLILAGAFVVMRGD